MYTVDSYKTTYLWKVLGVAGPWELLEPVLNAIKIPSGLSFFFFFFWSVLHSFFLNINEFFSKYILPYLSLNLNSIPILVLKF